VEELAGADSYQVGGLGEVQGEGELVQEQGFLEVQLGF
jgi:hypothetical protein